MVRFTMTWKSERGNECTDTGWAEMEEIDQWNAEIQRCIAEGDDAFKITVPTDHDSDWSSGQVRAILVKEIVPLVTRPAGW